MNHLIAPAINLFILVAILAYKLRGPLKEFVKERMALAKTKGTFWQDYKFTDPTTKKIAPKSMYCERLDDAVVCGGIYK